MCILIAMGHGCFCQVSYSSPRYPPTSHIFALLLNEPNAILLSMFSQAPSDTASFRFIILSIVPFSTKPPAENTNGENLPIPPAARPAVCASTESRYVLSHGLASAGSGPPILVWSMPHDCPRFERYDDVRCKYQKSSICATYRTRQRTLLPSQSSDYSATPGLVSSI